MKFLDKAIDAISKYAQKNASFCGQLCALGVSICTFAIIAVTNIMSSSGHSVGTILFNNGVLVVLSAFAYARYHKIDLWIFSPPAPPGKQDTLVLRGMVGTGTVYLSLIASSLLPLYLPGIFSPVIKSNPPYRSLGCNQRTLGLSF
jgi:hypothetical protein